MSTVDATPPLEPAAVVLLKQHGESVNAALTTFLDRLDGVPPRLIESIRYSLMAGGKRLRPALVLECFEACLGINETHTAHWRASALASAVAMELIHTFSLVHDDLPAMDDDDLRRGRPTNHKVFGEAMAILAGDAMVTLAFQSIAENADRAVAPLLVAELARASGPAGMIGGQVLDIDSENTQLTLEQLRQVHSLKTGALLTTACRMGAVCAHADEPTLAAVTAFGQHLGLAFQIVDDVLDVTSTPEQMGKATNKDQSKGKNTYPALLGLDRAREQAGHEVARAIDALEPLGSPADGLRILARFVTDRHA